MKEQKRKMSLPLPFVMYLPGGKDKSGAHEKKIGTRNPPWLQWFKLLVTQLRRDARGAKNNAGLVRWWQARREAEVWDMGRR